MITEWTKTMDVLSKMWVKHVYNLDLEHLPLEKPSDTTRKRRGGRRKASIEVQGLKFIKYNINFEEK